MNNELRVSIKTSPDTDFVNFTNRKETIMTFTSDESLAVNKSVSPFKTRTIVDYTESSISTGEVTIEKIDDSRYKIKTDSSNFNPKVNVNINDSSIFTISSSGGIAIIECADFDLSSVEVGDKAIFYNESNDIQPKEIPFTIVNKEDNKIFVEDLYGMSSFSGPIVSSEGFSVYKPEILDSYIIRLNGDIQTTNHGLYAIESATDKFIIIKCDKQLIETSVVVNQPSVKVFSKVINFINLEVATDCILIIDDKEIEITSFGKGVFTATLQASSIAIKNKTRNVINTTVIFGTTSLDSDNFSC